MDIARVTIEADAAAEDAELFAALELSGFCFLKGRDWEPHGAETKNIVDRAPLKEIIDIDIDVEVDVDIDSYLSCSKKVSMSVQVLFHGLEAVMVLTLRILK